MQITVAAWINDTDPDSTHRGRLVWPEPVTQDDHPRAGAIAAAG